MTERQRKSNKQFIEDLQERQKLYIEIMEAKKTYHNLRNLFSTKFWLPFHVWWKKKSFKLLNPTKNLPE